jgi:hypothetical protein
MMSMLEQTRHILGLWQGQSSDSSSALNHYLETMVEVLNTLLNLQEQGDWIFLADVLEYEMADSLNDLKELLPKLINKGH